MDGARSHVDAMRLTQPTRWTGGMRDSDACAPPAADAPSLAALARASAALRGLCSGRRLLRRTLRAWALAVRVSLAVVERAKVRASHAPPCGCCGSAAAVAAPASGAGAPWDARACRARRIAPSPARPSAFFPFLRAVTRATARACRCACACALAGAPGARARGHSLCSGHSLRPGHPQPLAACGQRTPARNAAAHAWAGACRSSPHARRAPSPPEPCAVPSAAAPPRRQPPPRQSQPPRSHDGFAGQARAPQPQRGGYVQRARAQTSRASAVPSPARHHGQSRPPEAQAGARASAASRGDAKLQPPVALVPSARGASHLNGLASSPAGSRRYTSLRVQRPVRSFGREGGGGAISAQL
jgi:hypothetical protein